MKIDPSIISWPLRTFDKVQSVDARIVILGGERLVQCCSTQYLAMPWTAKSQKRIAKTVHEATPSDYGSFGSNFLGGTHESRLTLEKDLAERCGYPKGLAFASGWAANYALGEAVGRICDLIISDRRSHNSLIHGLRASKAKVIVADLNSQSIRSLVAEQNFIKLAVFSPAIEGITGEHVSPLWTRSLRKGTLWIRDDCHAFGAIGQTGAEDFDGQRPDVRVLGLSKACGVMGAVVCGPENFIDVLSQLASPWIFSTAVPPIVWKVNRTVVKIASQMVRERQQILNLANTFREHLRESNVTFTGNFHITGVRIPPSKIAQFESQVRGAGYYLKASQFPSRPVDDPCARVCFTPQHRSADAVKLIRVLVRVLGK